MPCQISIQANIWKGFSMICNKLIFEFSFIVADKIFQEFDKMY